MIKLFSDSYDLERDVSKKPLNTKHQNFRLVQIDWLNGVLRHFQQCFSHTVVTAHIIHVFPAYHQY